MFMLQDSHRNKFSNALYQTISRVVLQDDESLGCADSAVHPPTLIAMSCPGWCWAHCSAALTECSKYGDSLAAGLGFWLDLCCTRMAAILLPYTLSFLLSCTSPFLIPILCKGLCKRERPDLGTGHHVARIFLTLLRYLQGWARLGLSLLLSEMRAP